MFVVTPRDISKVLSDFEIMAEIQSASELQRYDYAASSKEVRLILKAEPVSGPPLVLRFKNEADVTMKMVEEQSRFADTLRRNGILTPFQYKSDGAFAREYEINGYKVIVTVEQFVENEVRLVDAAAAEKTGELLAKMHGISEKENLHVANKVLFDPFSKNDLFDFEAFQSLEPGIGEDSRDVFHSITRTYHAYTEILAPLKRQPGYAVQGDISNCNLYRTASGEIGIFDFNRCGDNNLFCDAVMQAIFEARLMDYPDNIGDNVRPEILSSFLRGYRSVRDFSGEQKNWYPYLYAIITAFWSSDISWNEDSLTNAVKSGNRESVQKWLRVIRDRLNRLDHTGLE